MEVTSKRCFKCGLILPLTEFYTHPETGDGHLNKCKQCTRKDVHENYMKKIENDAYVEKERARGRDKYRRLHYKRNNCYEYHNISKNTRRINKRTKTFIVNETGEKLNTMKKHCNFIYKHFPLYTIF